MKKIALRGAGPGGSGYARILREVSTLSRLQHPNVVRYFQVRGAAVGGQGRGGGGEGGRDKKLGHIGAEFCAGVAEWEGGRWRYRLSADMW